jgi:hypothetical protein
MGQFHQLVCAHFFLVPKVHKDSQLITAFLHFWDIQGKKLLIKILVTLTSGVNFSNILQAAFLRSFFLLTVLENVGEINSTQ